MRVLHLTLIGAISVAWAGCSASSSSTGAPAPASQSTESKSSAKTVAAIEESPAPKSVFSIDQNSRDPFYPKAKRLETVEQPTRVPEAAVDVLSLLQAGFQGVIGSGETRIGLINNVMLEPGRQTVIPISVGGQTRSVPVRCREVLRDAVVIEVQGYSQPVRLVRPTGD